MLFSAAPERRAAASSFMDTARPPASSAGDTILEPLESLLRLFWRLALALLRLFAAVIAEKLVLITTDMVIFLDLNYHVRVATGRLEEPGRSVRTSCADVCKNGAPWKNFKKDVQENFFCSKNRLKNTGLSL